MRIRHGFSLIELLVVVAVVAVLAALLLPAARTVRESGKRTACLGNMRQMGMAVFSYATDNHGLLPNVQIKVAAIPAWGTNPNINYTWCDDRLAGKYLDLPSWAGAVSSRDGHNLLTCPSDTRGKLGSYFYPSYGLNFDYAPDINNPGDWKLNSRTLAQFSRKTDRLIIIESNESRFHPGWGNPVPMTQSVTQPVNHDFYGHPGSWHNWRSYHGGTGANAAFMDGRAAWIEKPQAMARSGEILVR